MNGKKKNIQVKSTVRIPQFRRSLAQGRAFALKGRQRRGRP
jgi:hypothetical protein